MIKKGMEKIKTVYSDKFLTDYPTVDCENPDRVEFIHSKIKDVAEFIEPEPCTLSDLAMCHSESLIKTVQRTTEVYDTAILAAGGAMLAAETALREPCFALVRPPGHHAGHDFNGGFCFFNNMALAVKNLLSHDTIERALIVDIDLHYGNGTYDIVRSDPRITFRNIDARSREAFFKDLEEALSDGSSYDILGCSVGFDTYVRDWGGMLYGEDYHRVGSSLVSANHRLFCILEGGYYVADLGTNTRFLLTGILKACS
jgi:acetoin utilization deacetylase AcuC-like enzyme